MRNLSPMNQPEMQDRNHHSHRLGNAEYPGSKSDNALARSATYQENTYLSRKIER